ncbi:MAG: 50S ribosomal protein L11 methyltransferase [Candidatus Binataceae bacterium]
MAAKQTYTRAIFRTPAAASDDAAGILIAGGALGCAVAGMSRPGAAAKSVVTLEAWFDRVSPARLAHLKSSLNRAGMLADCASGGARRIADPGWSTIWMNRFAPFRIGRHFLIVPPWRRATEAGRVTLTIQPGQAFGTGHHATTAGAMRAIEESIDRKLPRAALDVGTGSGILAIAMALLGVREVTAIDIDPIALDNARTNAELCGVDGQIRFSSVPLQSIRRRFDLVAANILSSTLIELAPRFARLVAPGGTLVLGGILAREAREVMRHYRSGFRTVRRATWRGWTTLVLMR